jgi:predicted ATPase
MNSVYCIRIDAYPGAMEEYANREDRFPHPSSRNLASWYKYLALTQPGQNLMFLTALSEAIRGLPTLRFAPGDGGQHRLVADFVGPWSHRASYSLDELSEGQRCLIGLYMILHFLLASGQTVFIDEPDNFISTREIQPWLNEASSMVEEKRGQLILISHHPEILSLWAVEYGVQFFREENGQVRLKRLSQTPSAI